MSEDAAAVVAELASNAVLHGRVPGRDFELRLVLKGEGGSLRVEVSDTRCEALPPEKPAQAEAGDEGGRGLLIVEALGARWGVEEGPVPRKTVWAELDR